MVINRLILITIKGMSIQKSTNSLYGNNINMIKRLFNHIRYKHYTALSIAWTIGIYLLILFPPKRGLHTG